MFRNRTLCYNETKSENRECTELNEETLQLFKTLTELPGAPGNEQHVRAFMRTQLEKYSDEIVQDRLGGIFGVRKSEEKDAPKILVAGHMDEVAFMVTNITENGMIRFQPLGGWHNQVLLSQRVTIYAKEREIPGVIASTPPHLLTPEQRKKTTEIKDMLIDVGADNQEDAMKMGIRPGQSIIPICPFTVMANPKKIMAKAWDNRYGCGLAVELLKELKDEKVVNHLYSGANVMEEVGLRGAQVSTNMIQPDLFFALDASAANDVTGDKNQFGQLGKGALLRIYDPTMVTHRTLRDFVLDTAESNDIPYQYFVSGGGTDAGRVHTMHEGIPSTVIGICSRYIHTAASIIHSDDYLAAKELLVKLIRTLDRSTVDTILQNP